jgi:hypothetical protein
MSKALQLLLVASLALSGCDVSIASDCRYTAERSGQHPVAGAKRLVVSARAGELDLKGRKDITQVSASGKACASHQELLDRIRIELRLEGDVLRVSALMPDIDADDAPDNANATLDLEIEVPDNLPLELIDSSGDAEIDGLAALDVTDSSGELRISHIAGDLEVTDSSGDVRIDGSARTCACATAPATSVSRTCTEMSRWKRMAPAHWSLTASSATSPSGMTARATSASPTSRAMRASRATARATSRCATSRAPSRSAARAAAMCRSPK